jgi:hypothetical protein
MVGDYLAYFNRPPPGGHDTTIRDMLLAYINGATPGSEIRGHITTIGPPPKEELDIAQALINAHKRGVQVFLVHDGEEMQTPRGACGCENSGFSNVCVVDYDACNLGFRPLCDPLRGAAGGGCGGCICEWEEQPEGYKLEEYFGTRHKYCGAICEGGAVTSCVSCVTDPPTDAATHHIKNWLFSNTVVSGKTRTYSTWVTSYNLTKTSDGQFNDVFIVNDNSELYAAYVESFKSFYGQRRTDDFYNVLGRGHHVIPSANTEISYSPNKTSDHVASALSISRIDRYEPGCSLKVANLSISSSRKAVIDELRRIRALGCQVQVTATNFYGTAISDLLSEEEPGAPVELRQSTQTTIHSKMMLYKGRYDGTPGRTFVWGGSHNWNLESLRMNDEVFVAISRLGIYKSYSVYFDAIWERSK